MRVKAVLFDLGGTLMNQGSFLEITIETFHKILKLKGIEKPKSSVKKAIVEADSKLKLQFGEDVPKDVDYYVRWNLEVLHRLGIYDRDSELADHIDKHWFDYMEIEPSPGVFDVLRKLTDRGVKLGIVTNGYQSDLEKILPKLRLEDVFDILVAADTIDKKKPDPDIFLYTIRKLKVSPCETVFVGDEYDNDYVGAEKAGLNPFLLQARRKRRQKDVPAGINLIHNLPELLSKIEI
jgi:putative hydrolase of the HAD superfamily